MLNIEQLQLSTIEALRNIRTEHCETVEYMKKYGTGFEKAIATLILAASGDDQNA